MTSLAKSVAVFVITVSTTPRDSIVNSVCRSSIVTQMKISNRLTSASLATVTPLDLWTMVFAIQLQTLKRKLKLVHATVKLMSKDVAAMSVRKATGI